MLPAFGELDFQWGVTTVVNLIGRLNRPERFVMIPPISNELLAAAVEMVCYFCTAIGIVLTFFLAPRG